MRLLSDKTLRLVVNEEKALPDYLMTVLKLPEGKAHIENNATGTSDSMRNISQKTIKSIPVPVLPFNKQREVVHRFSLFNEEMVLIQNAGTAMLNDIYLLPKKILAQAFEM
jgi:type I restriction enzyme, S subunit